MKSCGDGLVESIAEKVNTESKRSGIWEVLRTFIVFFVPVFIFSQLDVTKARFVDAVELSIIETFTQDSTCQLRQSKGKLQCSCYNSKHLLIHCQHLDAAQKLCELHGVSVTANTIPVVYKISSIKRLYQSVWRSPLQTNRLRSDPEDIAVHAPSPSFWEKRKGKRTSPRIQSSKKSKRTAQKTTGSTVTTTTTTHGPVVNCNKQYYSTSRRIFITVYLVPQHQRQPLGYGCLQRGHWSCVYHRSTWSKVKTRVKKRY
eukprot:m.72102 g.72102  ORF g.72102 m.72102 type:complete len:258 (+) comp11727_c0_seq6:125-898(+)